MSEFELMRVERWGERRSAVRRYGLSSVKSGCLSASATCHLVSIYPVLLSLGVISIIVSIGVIPIF